MNQENHNDVIKALFVKYGYDWPSLSVPNTFDLLEFLVGMSLDMDIHTVFGLSLAPYLRTDDRYSLIFTTTVANPVAEVVERLGIEAIEECIATFDSSAIGKHTLAVKVRQVHQDLRHVASFDQKEELPFYTKYRELRNITPNIKSDVWISTINRHLPEGMGVVDDDEVLITSSAPLSMASSLLILYKLKMADLMLYLGFSTVMMLAHAFSHAQMTCFYKNPNFSKNVGLMNAGASCLATMHTLAPFAVAQLLFDEILDPSTVNYTIVLSNNIRRAAYLSLATVSWLDDPSRAKAVERLSTIIDVVAFPSHLTNRSTLNEHHSFLPSFEKPFIVDYLESNQKKLAMRKQLLRPTHGQPKVRRDDMEIPLIIVNAYYLPMFHMMVIPGAILQAPFVSSELLDAVNYGSIGRVVGHEIMHAFDPNEASLSRTGERVDLFTDKARGVVEEMLSCLKNQVNEAGKSTTLGNASIGQVFADSAGIEVAYKAYSMLRKEPRRDEYASDQLFFASGCFSYCSLLKDKVSPNQRYPSAAMRCNLPAMNMKEFSEAFFCSAGAPVNPSKRCSIFGA
ncbi:neprilysin-1-like [Ornithodoros turicata]|uniref:neprilysin-1-like n=1 Tax=Ornithodoros turicata TaxID=34597 RepID=UPI003138E5CF